MLPIFPVLHSEDAPLGHSEAKGQLIHRPTSFYLGAYFPHFTWVQFCAALICSNSTVPSSLSHHIRHVLFMSRKEKMIWIAANWIITRMANLQSIWNWAAFKQKSYSMCDDFSRCLFERVKCSIPSVSAKHPRPAFFRFIFVNAVPKVNFRVLDFCRHLQINNIFSYAPQA